MEVKKYANLLCIYTILSIGGVETWLYEVARKYKERDIAIVYINCLNDEHLKRLEKIVGKDNLIHYTKDNGRWQKLYCDTLFLNYDIHPFIDNIQADKVYNMVHANFWLQRDEIKIPKHDYIDEYVAVSEANKDGLLKAEPKLKKKISVCYNPITIDKEDKKRVLLLVSATRLSKEKGKERMIRLANEFDKNKIPYLWLIFTNSQDTIENPNIVYMKPTLNIRPWLQKADYVVQLSSSEGFCYTIYETLTLNSNTGVIVTDLPTFREMGVSESNGFILPLDMKNIPVDEIYQRESFAPYKPKNDIYDKLLSKSKTRTEDINLMKVTTLKPFWDTFENIHVRPSNYMFHNPDEHRITVGDSYETTEQRAKYLEKLGLVKLEVKIGKKKSSRKQNN